MTGAAVLLILKLGASYVFQFQQPGRHPAAAVLASQPLSQATEQNLREQFERTAHLLNQLVGRQSSRLPSDKYIPSDPLLTLGRLLYTELIPAAVQQALRQLPPGSPLILATNDPDLPWELAYDGQHYLALKHALARRMMVHQPPRQNQQLESRQWTALLIGNPTGDLPESDEEIEQLIHLIEAFPGTMSPRFLLGRRATKERVMRELASGTFDLIHYSGHATFDLHNPAASGLALAGEELLAAPEIQRIVGGRPLVFLNGCESAREQTGDRASEGMAYLGLAAQGLASAFILGGAQAFVGTFWPIRNAGSREFALAFYRAALQGEPIGEALRQARAGVHRADPVDPLWASFLLYGDPQARLLPARRTERRPATVLVAHLRRLDHLFDEMHGEDAVEAAQACFTVLAEQSTRYGGQVHSLAYDTFIGIFGIPTARENDAERAVRAALGIVGAMKRQHPGQGGNALDLGLGISSGEVFIARKPNAGTDDAAAGAQTLPTVMGEAVDQAVWLARQADPEAILIAGSVQRLTGHLFEVVPFPATTPKGMKSFTPYRVLGLRPEPPQPWEVPHRMAMIGRERELAMLVEAWQMVRQGRGQLVGVAGEAGIGKSRLAYEFRRALADEEVRWLVASCPSAYRPGPYEMVAQLLSALFGLLATDDEATARRKVRHALQHLLGTDASEGELQDGLALLGDILALPFPEVSQAHLDPKRRHRRLVSLLGRLLARRAAEKPLILMLEDLHRVDDASLEVLSQLVVGIDRLPVLIIALFRSEAEWQPPWWNRRNYRPVHLDTLDKISSRALLAALLQTDEVPEDVARGVLPQAGGNPFFLRELVASLQESETLVRKDGEWCLARPLEEAEVPGTVQRVILMRMTILPDAAQRVLPIATVAGDDFEPAVLRAVAAETGDELTLEEGLAQLEEREFIYHAWEEDVYHFTHALIQEVAYGSLLAEERRRLHRRLGRALERVYAGRETEVLERLAHHFYYSVIRPAASGAPEAVVEEAGVTDLTRAVDYVIQAGVRANRQYAARQAIAHFQRALNVAGHLPPGEKARRAACYEGLGDAHNLLGEFRQAIEAYETAFAQLTAKPLSSEQRRHVADLARRIGRLHGWQANYDEALHWMEKGLQALGERLDDQSRATPAMIHIHTGTIYYYRGQYDEAAARIQRGLGIVEGTDHLSSMAEGYNLLGAVHDAKGERTQAIRYYEQSLSLWEKLGDTYQMARVRDNLGVAYFYLGRWAEAAESHRRALAFFERIEDRDQMTYACLNLGNVHLCRGEWDTAQELFDRARELSKEVGNLRMLALSHTNLGLVALEREDWGIARHHLEHSLGLLEEHRIEDFLAETYAALGRLCLGEGDATVALGWGRKALEAAQAQGMGLEEGLAHRVLGMAHRAQSDLAQAEEHLRQSLKVLDLLEHRYEVGRTLVQLAQVCRNAGRLDEVRDHLNRAMAIFEALGAQMDLHEAQRMANGNGGR